MEWEDQLKFQHNKKGERAEDKKKRMRGGKDFVLDPSQMKQKEKNLHKKEGEKNKS